MLLFFHICSGSIVVTSLKNIIRNEGFKGLYRGLSPTIIALLPNWTVSITFLVCFYVKPVLEMYLAANNVIVWAKYLRLSD